VIEDSVDYLDPALSYSAEGYAPLSMVYLSLLGYRQVRGPGGATVVPVLAENLPRVSRDRRTYTLTLRRGLTYSNGRTVEGERLQVRDREAVPGRLAGSGLLLEHRRRHAFRKDAQGRDLGHRRR
jgi:hypothetical protein